MKTLIEKIAAYRIATQSLIDNVKDFETFIKEHVPFELWKNFGIVKCGGQFAEYHLKISGKIIPNSTKLLGKGIHWAGDYNYWYDYVTGRELIEWSKELPALTIKAESYISNLIEMAEDINIK